MNAKQLLTVIPFHMGDIDRARALVQWIEILSPKLGPHCCLLAVDSSVPHEQRVEIGRIATRIFYFVEIAIVVVPPNAAGWPKASNAMFRIAAAHIKECFQLPWLWLEPDCIPLKPSWLDELAVAYHRCPKRFMGAVIQSFQPPLPPAHLAGCAVYPPETIDMLKTYTEGEQAWDIAGATYTVPRTFPTPLIHHHYGTKELPPIFKETRSPTDPVNTCTLDFIDRHAVLFHRCKDGSLIDVLQKQRNSAATPTAMQGQAPPEAQGKRRGRPRKAEPVPAP